MKEKQKKGPEEEKPVARKTMAGFSNTLSRLRVGMIVEFSGVPHRVSMVNDCRARLVPLSRKSVEIKTVAGKEVSFSRPLEGVNVSPESELPIIGFEP